MISQLHRFHGYNALRAVYRSGQGVRGQAMSLKYAPRRSGQGYRAAVVVSRKVSKSAVTRNRIRRRVYEVVRQSSPELLAGKDLVFTVFDGGVAELSAERLQAVVAGLLQKAANQPANSPRTSVSHDIVGQAKSKREASH